MQTLRGRYEPVTPADRDAAEQGYRLFRHVRSGASGASAPTAPRTLEIMQAALASGRAGLPEGLPADLDELGRLAAEGDWEGRYEREQAEADLGQQDRHLRENLLWLRDQLEGYKVAIESHARIMQEHQAAGWDDARIGEKLWGTYLSAVRELDGIEQALRDRIRAHRRGHARAERIDVIYAGLLDQFGGKGPHYEILCRSLAVVTADLEQANHPSVRAEERGLEGVKTLIGLQQELVNQLQKFTESTKVDVTDARMLREYGEAIAACAIKRLMNVQPQLAVAIVEDMKAEMEARGAGASLPEARPVGGAA